MEAPDGFTADQWRLVQVSIGTFLERIIQERNVTYETRFGSLERLIEERDRLYTAQFEADRIAVATALTVARESGAAAMLAQEKAILKAEQAQSQYNASHNDLTRKMERQYQDTLPRAEASVEFAALKDKYATLSARMDKREGETAGVRLTGSLILTIVLGVSAMMGLIALVASWVVFKKPGG